MKKYILILLSVVFALESCDYLDEVLDKEPQDQFTNDNFWTSETNVQTFANYFYNEFTGYGNGGASASFYFNTRNDDQASNGFTQWAYKQAPATNGSWSSPYSDLRRANLLIEKIPGIESMDETAKNHWMGVARLYRAMQHYYLIRSFGDIVYVDKVLDVTDEDKKLYLFGERMDRDLAMDKVLEDLNYAVANISKFSDSRTAINNAVANAIKADICLYEGTFCKYRTAAVNGKAADDSRALLYLTECKNACEVIMNNPMYTLSSSYRGNYTSLDLSTNKEMIMYKHYVQDGFSHCVANYTCTSTIQSGLSKAAFDAYLFTDGKPKATTTKVNTDIPVYNPTTKDLEISTLLAVRDPRLGMTIDPVLMYTGNGYERFASGMETTSSTGYGILKFDTDAMEPSYRVTTKNFTDAPVYWLAVIYLNYAEACAELGDDPNVFLPKSINKLRNRTGVKMPAMEANPAADPANNTDVRAGEAATTKVSNLIWEIRRERRVELMLDNNDRYWSLIRWHQLDKLDPTVYPDQVLGAHIGTLDTKATCRKTSDGYIDCSTTDPGNNRIYDPKHYLQPVPTDQILLYENAGYTLTQNPGWGTE